MSSNPAFAVTPRIGAGIVLTADTSYTSPTQVTTILTAGSSGTLVSRFVLQSLKGSALTPGIVNIWIYDGSTYNLYTQIAFAADSPSTTAAAYRYEFAVNDFYLPTGYSVRASITVSNTTGIKVFAFGGDL